MSGKLRKGKDVERLSVELSLITTLTQHSLSDGGLGDSNFDILCKCSAEICKHVR